MIDKEHGSKYFFADHIGDGFIAPFPRNDP